MKIKRLNENRKLRENFDDRTWSEIRNDYFDDDEGCICIDAWETEDGDEPGKVIAKVYTDGRVVYLDPRAKRDRYAREIIRDSVEEVSEMNESIKSCGRKLKEAEESGLDRLKRLRWLRYPIDDLS